jgi:hypothetical protein
MRYKEFEIRPNGFGRFDLHKTVVGETTIKVKQPNGKNKLEKTGETYRYEINVAYGMSFVRACQTLIDYHLADLDAETIQVYLDQYNKVTNEFIKKL